MAPLSTGSPPTAPAAQLDCFHRRRSPGPGPDRQTGRTPERYARHAPYSSSSMPRRGAAIGDKVNGPAKPRLRTLVGCRIAERSRARADAHQLTVIVPFMNVGWIVQKYENV